jgi:hypothetical protein
MLGNLELPIRGNNRDEYFLVEYEGFIRNLAEGMLYAIAADPEHFKSFGGNEERLRSMWHETKERVFLNTALYTPELLMDYLYPEVDDSDALIKEMLRLLAINQSQRQMDTIFSGGISVLANERFIRRIVVVNRFPFQPFQLDFLELIFSDQREKCIFITGDPLEVYRSLSHITTWCINSADDLVTVLKTSPEERLRETFFMLRQTLANSTITGEELILHRDKEIDELTKDKKYGIGTLLIFPLIR